MRKLLLVLLAVPALSFAASLDMSTLACKTTKLNASSTLSDVQANCLIKKQTTSKGRYEVEFRNDTTKKTVTCYFANNDPKSLLNSCK
jgi:hypothetical protein